MRNSAKFTLTGTFLLLATVTVFIFQNCAKAKFVDPDPVHSAMALGICQRCGDETGRGSQCRASKNDTFSVCLFESCNPGFKIAGVKCIPVVCEAGSIANCAVNHGEGRMTCNANGEGYGTCVAADCENGFSLTGGICVAVVEPEDNTPVTTPICVAGTHRDCSTESTSGAETCNEQGSGYGTCVLGSCKAGYNNQAGGECVANVCEPSTVTPCSVGAAVGFNTCNSQGAGWGVCEINGCQQGYNLKNGVCEIPVCTPGLESVCEFANGSGVKTCNQDGTDYGSCTLMGCQQGYYQENGQCWENKCTPSSQDTCVGESGAGVRYCYENGRGHGPCQLTSCDPGFKLKNGQCVTEDSCDAGETLACTQQFGTGVRTCNTNSHKLGPCELTACNQGYALVNQNGNACKKIK